MDPYSNYHHVYYPEDGGRDNNAATTATGTTANASSSTNTSGVASEAGPSAPAYYPYEVTTAPFAVSEPPLAWSSLPVADIDAEADGPFPSYEQSRHGSHSQEEHHKRLGHHQYQQQHHYHSPPPDQHQHHFQPSPQQPQSFHLPPSSAAAPMAQTSGLSPHPTLAAVVDYPQAPSAVMASQQADVVPVPAIPAMDFNGYILYAQGKPVPEELMRMPSGASVAEPGSILDEESGRTFHNHSTGRYFFPNDAAEQDRLDLQHRLVTLLLDGNLHRAPVVSPKNVLDIATGTGIWAIQFANLHPESNVIGTDLSLIQPDNAPPNVSFIKENSETDEWIFPEPFDFIFMRLVFTCFDDHRTVIRKAYDNLVPGGWIEFNDTGFELLSTDGTTAGTANELWVSLMLRAGAVVGRDFLVTQKYQHMLKEAGFVDVVEEVVPCPMNAWPADPRFQTLGKWQMTNADKAIRGTSWKLFRALGMAPDEIEDVVRRTKHDVRDTSIHGFVPWYFVYGRKPYLGEVVEQ